MGAEKPQIFPSNVSPEPEENLIPENRENFCASDWKTVVEVEWVTRGFSHETTANRSKQNKSSASESAKGCRTTKVDVNDASLIIYDLQVIEWTRWTVEADKFISDDVFMQSARLWKNLHIEPLNDSPLQSDSVVDVKWIVKTICLSLLSSSFDILEMWSWLHFNAS